MWKHKDALVNEILANLDKTNNGDPIVGYVYFKPQQKAYLITEVPHQGTKASDLTNFEDFYLNPSYKDSCRLELVPVPISPPLGQWPLDLRWAWIKNNLGYLADIGPNLSTKIVGGFIDANRSRWEPLFAEDHISSTPSGRIRLSNKTVRSVLDLYRNGFVYFIDMPLLASVNNGTKVIYGAADDLDAEYPIWGITDTYPSTTAASSPMVKMPDIDLAGYPKICPACAKPAYFTFSNHIDCSAKCKAQGQSVFKF